MDSINSGCYQNFLRNVRLPKSSASFFKFIIVMLLLISTHACITVKETRDYQSYCLQDKIIHKTGLKNNDIDRKRNKKFKKNEHPDENISEKLLYQLKNSDFYVQYSEKFGINFDGTENKELLMAVDEWLGTQYRWGGESKSGIDCSALVQFIYRDVFGIEISRTVSEICENDLTPIDEESLQPGDILCFKTKGRKVSHIGIYLKDDKFVHASRKRGVSISALTENYFRKRFVFAGRVTEAAEAKAERTFTFRLVK